MIFGGSSIAPAASGIGAPLIYHVVTGAGRVPVVFVHGITCDHSDWDPQVRALSTSHQTVAVDLRGHGRSPGTAAECSIERYGADVAEVMRSGRPRLSGFVAGERGGVVHELVPVRDWKGNVVGVAGGTFHPEKRDLEKMLKFLQRGETGLAELVDASGRIVASTRPGRAGRMTECSKRFAVLQPCGSAGCTLG